MLKAERREQKRNKEIKRIKQHNKNLGNIYKNAIEKRLIERGSNNDY
jgi:ribosomal protein L25 (general stress protein Ctc)